MKTNLRCLWFGLLLIPAGCDSSTEPLEKDDAVSVYDLQEGKIAPGETVTLRNVVVTGTGLVGFWVQEEKGGAHSGLWIDAGFDWTKAFTGVVPGALVDVTGTFVEYDMDGAWPDTVSEIQPDADGVVVLGEGVEPAPMMIDYEALIEPAQAEPWEGVVVGFAKTVTVDNTDTGYGGWSVSDGKTTLEMQNSMYRPDPLVLGDAFGGLAGVLQYSFGAFKLEPRSSADITPANGN